MLQDDEETYPPTEGYECGRCGYEPTPSELHHGICPMCRVGSESAPRDVCSMEVATMEPGAELAQQILKHLVAKGLDAHYEVLAGTGPAVTVRTTEAVIVIGGYSEDPEETGRGFGFWIEQYDDQTALDEARCSETQWVPTTNGVAEILRAVQL